MIKKWVMLAGLVLLLSPAAARADWLFTPHLGASFGGGSSFTYGASIGYMGAGKFGFEAEIARTPGFLDLDRELEVNPLLNANDIDFIDDSATSLMFNAIVGAPLGGSSTSSDGFRPYFSGGVGWVNADVQSDELLFEESDNKFAFNLGGGIMTYVGNFGVRGDVRYYQTLSEENTDNLLGLELGDYDFWRATVGVTFRW
jgi:opacity protein-like surface antigen